MKQKQTKNTHKLPLWLRQLDKVKRDLQGIRWPSAKEGFQQGLALMAMGLESLETEARNTISSNDPILIQKHILERIRQFQELDARWIARWRKERAKVLSF